MRLRPFSAAHRQLVVDVGRGSPDPARCRTEGLPTAGFPAGATFSGRSPGKSVGFFPPNISARRAHPRIAGRTRLLQMRVLIRRDALWDRRMEPAPTNARADPPRRCRKGLCRPIPWLRICGVSQCRYPLQRLGLRSASLVRRPRAPVPKSAGPCARRAGRKQGRQVLAWALVQQVVLEKVQVQVPNNNRPSSLTTISTAIWSPAEPEICQSR